MVKQPQLANILRWRASLHPFVMDLGLTAATEFAVLIAGLLIVSLFSRMLGAVALGEYLLLRRVYSWLQSGALLGLSGALPRCVAHAVDKPRSERQGYLFAAAVCAGAVAVCLGAILNAARGSFARLLFGSLQMTHLVFPLSLLFAGGAADAMVYGYYRGRLFMTRANALEFCNLLLVPVAAVLVFFRTGSVALIVSVMGGLMLVCAGLFAAPIARGSVTGGPPRFKQQAAELLRYGIPRVPAAFGLHAIFTLAPMIAVHYLPISQVSYLLLGTSLLMGVSTSATPLGLLLLSKVSMMLAQGRLAEVRAHLAYLQAAVLELYVFVCLQLVVFADVLVRAWVGSGFLKGILIIRLVLLAIPLFLLFVSLHSVIDAASVTAYNTYNIFVSSAVFLALSALGARLARTTFLLETIAGAMVVAIAVLAWLTSRTARKLYDVRVDWRQSTLPLLLGVLLGGTSLFLHWTQGFGTGLAQFLLIELGTGALFLGALKQLGSPWLPFFWNLVFPRPAQARAMAGR